MGASWSQPSDPSSIFSLCVAPRWKGVCDEAQLKTVTWNIAAVNNNPFEYWITHEDEAYNKLMQDVQEFVDAPGSRDVPVSAIFSEEMWTELKALMAAEGWDVQATEELWRSDFSRRKIISGFMKDASLGEKRFASMPDRVTNTINTLDQGKVNRPTVISCYAGDMSSMEAWWTEWKSFMFGRTLTVAGKGGVASTKTPAAMLPPIKRAKYPAVTEAEEAISVPLQALCLAIFDAILVHVVSASSPDGTWLRLKQQMLEALYAKKDGRILEILATTYNDVDVVFLQEVAGDFIRKAKTNELRSRYHVVHCASLDASRDQNSLLLLSRRYFDGASVVELTAEAMKSLDASAPVAPGDLLLVSCADMRGRQYLLASFHGDTNGLATLPVLAAVHGVAEARPDHRLVFGLDANTYVKGSKKYQGVIEFGRDFVSKGYTSCWGDAPDPANHTTFNARTYLQPQLQKAARSDEKEAKGDKNPKDHIVFSKSAFELTSVVKDNTGDRTYLEGVIFPTLQFPSDHGVVFSTLTHSPTQLTYTVARAAKGLGLIVTPEKLVEKVETWSDAHGKLQKFDRLLAVNGTPCQGRSLKELMDPSFTSYEIAISRN